METSANLAVAGADLSRPLDALFVNAPLCDYSLRPRINGFTLPVLGMGYIATYAARQGFNVGVIDAEALGLGVEETTQLVNDVGPRWAGFNLLAPTHEISARIAAGSWIGASTSWSAAPGQGHAHGDTDRSALRPA